MQLIVAEKPSVGRDLARVLGLGRGGGGGYIAGKDRVITWCVGHLVELDEPAAYDPAWKAWRLDTLPMLPRQFRLRAVKGSRDQLQVVKGLLRDDRFKEVVNACDAGREGELIFRYVYELCGGRLPVRRLWISSLTDEAINAGFQGLKPGQDYDPLADAARSRSEADWLVGLNATRAVTVRHRTGGDSPLYSIGRVQTPTLALVVARDEEIRKFVPRDYWEVRGRFTTAAGETFDATFRHQRQARLDSQPLAAALIARLDAHALARDPDGPAVEKVQQKTVREPPPLLFDLTTLQRTANRRFGLSAARTLEIAQSLYETHKVLTYPRTDSRYLSKDVAPTLPRLFRALQPLPMYGPFAQTLLAAADGPEAGRRLQSPANRRVFDDAKVEDHHAIIPTGAAVRWDALDRDQQRVFDLVARRFLGAFFPDAVFAGTELVVRVGPGTAPAESPRAPAAAPAAAVPRGPNAPPEEDESALTALPPPPDRFFARGRVRLEAGWQEVAGFGGPGDGKSGRADRDGPAEGEGEAPSLPAVQQGQRLDGRFTPVAKQTRPPPHHTEATLLSGDGDRGQDHRGRGPARGDEGHGSGHASHPRRHHRDADQARVHRPRRQERPGDADRRGADPGAAGAEPGLGRADRQLGGAAGAHRPRQREPHRLHAGHRPLRHRGGGRHPHSARQRRHVQRPGHQRGSNGAGRARDAGDRARKPRTSRAPRAAAPPPSPSPSSPPSSSPSASPAALGCPALPSGDAARRQARLGLQPLARGLHVRGLVRDRRQTPQRDATARTDREGPHPQGAVARRRRAHLRPPRP